MFVNEKTTPAKRTRGRRAQHCRTCPRADQMNLAVALPAANGGAIRMDCAAAGTAVAPEITVYFFRRRQSQGGMNAPLRRASRALASSPTWARKTERRLVPGFGRLLGGLGGHRSPISARYLFPTGLGFDCGVGRGGCRRQHRSSGRFALARRPIEKLHVHVRRGPQHGNSRDATS